MQFGLECFAAILSITNYPPKPKPYHIMAKNPLGSVNHQVAKRDKASGEAHGVGSRGRAEDPHTPGTFAESLQVGQGGQEPGSSWEGVINTSRYAPR